MKKILVTGATGFIGNYVIQNLVNNSSYQIIASSRDLSKAKSFSWIKRVQFIPFDLRQLDSSINYFDFFQQPDLMIHLAWEGLPNYKDSFHIEENLPRHFSFLNNIIENGLNDLTVVGTCLEYGMQEGELSEDLKTLPSVPYAIAKDELRKSLERLKATREFIFKWIRLFYLYGKGQNPKSLLSQLDRALEEKSEVFNMSGGEQVRDYLPVEIVAEQIIKASLQTQVTGSINCCSGKPITVKELVEQYLKERGKEIILNLGYYPYPDYEPMKFWGDTKKLKMIIDNE